VGASTVLCTVLVIAASHDDTAVVVGATHACRAAPRAAPATLERVFCSAEKRAVAARAPPYRTDLAFEQRENAPCNRRNRAATRAPFEGALADALEAEAAEILGEIRARIEKRVEKKQTRRVSLLRRVAATPRAAVARPAQHVHRPLEAPGVVKIARELRHLSVRRSELCEREAAKALDLRVARVAAKRVDNCGARWQWKRAGGRERS